MEKPIYDFKKGDIDYDDKRKQYLINFWKFICKLESELFFENI